MDPSLNLYPIKTAAGAVQMALDDVMLEHAVTGTASLRFYIWNAPTLSLGYFQKADERLSNSALAGLPWLRRATGGDAILHGDGDVTYSLALPADKLWHNDQPWLCRFHHHLRLMLRKLGVTAKLVVCGEEAKLAPTLCFRHHTPGDLLVKGVKVVGSAQRKSHGALLQHGTIRLKTSQRVPELPGIEELSGVSLTMNAVQRGLMTRLLTHEKWFTRITAWTETDTARAAAIVAERYGNDDWNSKR